MDNRDQNSKTADYILMAIVVMIALLAEGIADTVIAVVSFLVSQF